MKIHSHLYPIKNQKPNTFIYHWQVSSVKTLVPLPILNLWVLTVSMSMETQWPTLVELATNPTTNWTPTPSPSAARRPASGPPAPPAMVRQFLLFVVECFIKKKILISTWSFSLRFHFEKKLHYEKNTFTLKKQQLHFEKNTLHFEIFLCEPPGPP